MATVYISIQGSYQTLELALFKDSTCLKQVLFQDRKASSFLIPFLNDLLREFSYTLSDLSFIAVDKGPGAFTSLRVVIATLNGMGFAARIPLIGVDGLYALYQQTYASLDKNQCPDLIVCLLNAYGKEVYFFTQYLDKYSQEVRGLPDHGYKNVYRFLEELHKKYPEQTILCTGNGTELYRDLITTTLGIRVVTQEHILQTASAYFIGTLAYQSWQEDQSCVQQSIVPHYIKTQFFAITR